MFVNSLFWFDNDFEIELKYHHKIVVLFLKAQILSLQDVVSYKLMCQDDITEQQISLQGKDQLARITILKLQKQLLMLYLSVAKQTKEISLLALVGFFLKLMYLNINSGLGFHLCFTINLQ